MMPVCASNAQPGGDGAPLRALKAAPLDAA
jgi:hypothetical protein